MPDRLRSFVASKQNGWLKRAAHEGFLGMVDRHQKDINQLSDDRFAQRINALRQPLAGNQQWDPKPVAEVFGLVREAASRSIGMRHYSQQMLAGYAMLHGAVAEMATGEGKTLAATLTAVVNSLRFGSAHVMTVNPYLAARDHQFLEPLYRLLGLQAGVLDSNAGPGQKRAAYSCDITYGVGAEFGFDYLRDQITLADQKLVAGQRFRQLLRGEEQLHEPVIQARRQSAIVDEADSVMIDEACTALILSGSMGDRSSHPQPYLLAEKLVDQLSPNVHFLVDDRQRQVKLLEAGRPLIDNPPAQPGLLLKRPWTRYIQQALRARYILNRDQDYVVIEDHVQIVDQFTGRIFEDRAWSGGLHQAVEAREGVTITEESNAIVRISRQKFLTKYDHLSGMTGTAGGSEKEFRSVYKMPVFRVPLRRPTRRTVLPPRTFASASAKWQALVEEIRQCHQRGQPVLIGTRTIENSELLATMLGEKKLCYTLLNARQNQEEAEIIGQAGQTGSITIATNLAGRGADIKLAEGLDKLGGLFVIATEPCESQRIDRQLAGRCGRQGNPGTYRMYLSADDDLFHQFAPALGQQIRRGNKTGGEVNRDFTAGIAKAQGEIELLRYNQRQDLYRADKRMEGLLEKVV